MFCYCFVFVFIYIYFRPNDSYQTSHLKIYCIDVRQIFTVGRTKAVDDQCKITFSTTQGTLLWQPIFVVVHGCRWAHAASGAAGRANAGLCHAQLLKMASYAPALGRHFGIARSVGLSVPWRSCLGYRHAGCLQLSHRRPQRCADCGSGRRSAASFECMDWRRRPDWRRNDMPPSNCHWLGPLYRLAAPGGDTLFGLKYRRVFLFYLHFCCISLGAM